MCFQGKAFLCPGCGFAPRFINGFPAFAPEREEPGMGEDEQVFDGLASVEAGNFWFRARNRLIVQILDRFFPSAASMLEIGCGTGFVLSGIAEQRPGMRLWGSDVSFQGLELAAHRLQEKARLLQMDAMQIPFAGEFEVIGAFDVLEHIQDDAAVLAQMRQAVTPGGGVAITVPQHPWLWSGMDTLSGHVRRYRAKELRAKLERAGFRCVYSTSFVSLLLPLMFLSRLRFQKQADQQVSSGELDLPGPLNAMLRVVMQIEVQLIQAGLRLPSGGSLLMVGRT